MHITSYSSSKVRASSHSGPGHTTRHICTLRRGGPMPNIPPVHTLSISMLKHSANARRWPPMRLCCSRRRLQQPRRCPCSCRPTGRAPLSRPAGRLKDTPTGAGRTGPGGRMASTMTRLPSGCCFPGLVQLPPPAALRAAKAVLRGQKRGVKSHGLAAPQTKVKEVLPTKSAIAETMVRGFMREKDGDVPISRA